MIDTGGGQVTIRGRGFTRWKPNPVLQPRVAKIGIGNGINFERPDVGWAETNPVVTPSPGAPPDWDGSFDFADGALDAPMQVHFGNTADPSARVMWGFRRSDRPRHWANMRPLQANGNVALHQRNTNRALWIDVWQATNLRIIATGDAARKEIVLKNANAPTSFRFSILSSPHLTFSVVNERLVWKDAQGRISMRSDPAWGHDSATLVNNPDGYNYIRVSVTHVETREVNGKTFEVVDVTPNADDMAGAIYPVIIDPTVDITSPSDYIDNDLLSVAGDYNRGANTGTTNKSDSASTWRSQAMHHYDGTLIPAGTPTKHEWFITCSSGTTTYTYFAQLLLNTGWVEGTAVYGIETGSPCHNYLAYDASSPTAWAGGTGADTAGTDYTQDHSSWPDPRGAGTGTAAWTYGVQYTWLLDPDWAASWRDSPSGNGGWNTSAGKNSNAMYMRSINHSTPSVRPYITVTYDEPGSGGLFFFNHRILG